MKSNKHSIKPLLTLALASLMNTGLLAQTVDVSKSIKDIKVMTRIMETDLESSEKNFPGRPNIKGTYLAEQGYLFNIQLNGLGSFGIPGLASWDDGRLELNIPEIITEAISSIDIDDTIIPEPVLSTLDDLYEDDELQDNLRILRENQREVRRNVYQIRREIRKTEDKNKREELEKKLDTNRDSLRQSSEEYANALNSYKSEKKMRKVKNSADAVDAIFTSICDYGQSLKALKKHEKFTLVIKGGVDKEGENATQIYVIDEKSISKCSDSKKLKNKAIYYTL